MEGRFEKTIIIRECKTSLAIMFVLENAAKDKNVLLVVRDGEEVESVKKRILNIFAKFCTTSIRLTRRGIEFDDGGKIRVGTPDEMLEPGCAYSCVVFLDCEELVSKEGWHELNAVLTINASIYKIKRPNVNLYRIFPNPFQLIS